jgi:very-short-patch-repair endonuclease
MRAHPTDAEKRLWSMRRDRRFARFKFRRQQVIAPFIVDFVCLSERLVVEADGSQHADDKSDASRDAYLQKQGFRTLHFWNNDVLADGDAVSGAILAAVASPHPPKPAAWAPPSPARGEGQDCAASPAWGEGRDCALSSASGEGLHGGELG